MWVFHPPSGSDILHPMRRTWTLLVVGLVLGATSIASAQLRSVKTRWAERSLTMPNQTLRLDLAPPDHALLDSGVLGEGYGFRFSGWDDDGDGDPDDVVVISGVGLAYGVSSSVELGAKVLPVRFHPDPDYLDLEVYGRWAFVRTRAADLGLQLTLQLPTDRPRMGGFGVGMPVRIRMGEVGRLDLGIELETLFWDIDGDDELEVDFNLDLPVALAFSITERFYVGGSFGLLFVDFDSVALRGGGHVGYTVGRRSPLVDFTGAFRFYGGDRYHYGHARDRAWRDVGLRRWEIIGGLRVHFRL
jgi:hypothetical protein